VLLPRHCCAEPPHRTRLLQCPTDTAHGPLNDAE
jgi:hypothetical protein